MPLHTHTHARNTVGQGGGGHCAYLSRQRKRKKNNVDPQRGTLRAWAPFFAGLQNLREKMKIKEKKTKLKSLGKLEEENAEQEAAVRGGWGGEEGRKNVDRSIGKLHKKLQGCRRRCLVRYYCTVPAPFSFLLPSVTFPLLPSAQPLPCPCLDAFPCVVVD